MSSILDQIFMHKRQELAATRALRPAGALVAHIATLPAPPDFAAALRDKTLLAPRLIAEIKQRSPSRGLLRPDFDPVSLAQSYALQGAAAISVLTDERFFGGSLAILQQISRLDLGLPLLRKDFLFDPYQLLEARAAGASAVLLIVAMLSETQLQELLAAATELKMTALVECHTVEEMDRAVAAGAQALGVNNRDLHTFRVNLETCLQLRPLAPAGTVFVAESGIHTAEDVRHLAQAGVDAMLVGESLVTADDPAQKIQDLYALLR